MLVPQDNYRGARTRPLKSSQPSGTINHDVIDGKYGKPWTMDQDKAWDQERYYGQ